MNVFLNKQELQKELKKCGGIKTYKKFLEEKRYKGKKLNFKQMTYHHLKHKSEGGPTTIENGANVREPAHQYMHSLPREQEEIINDMIRDWKMNCVIMRGDGSIEDARSLALPHTLDDEDCIVIPAFDTTPEQEAQRKKSAKRDRLRNPTRAQQKQELRDLIQEYEEDEYEL